MVRSVAATVAVLLLSLVAGSAADSEGGSATSTSEPGYDAPGSICRFKDTLAAAKLQVCLAGHRHLCLQTCPGVVLIPERQHYAAVAQTQWAAH